MPAFIARNANRYVLTTPWSNRVVDQLPYPAPIFITHFNYSSIKSSGHCSLTIYQTGPRPGVVPPVPPSIQSHPVNASGARFYNLEARN